MRKLLRKSLGQSNGEISYLNNIDKEVVRRLIAQSFSSDSRRNRKRGSRSDLRGKLSRADNGEKYVLVVQWDRPRPTPVFGEANSRYIRLLGCFLTAIAVCYVFARYLSARL